MQIVTSWMKKGIEQGIEQEQEQSRLREVSLVTKLLRSKLGGLSEMMADRLAQLSISQLDLLGDVLMGFESEADLQVWLAGVV